MTLIERAQELIERYKIASERSSDSPEGITFDCMASLYSADIAKRMVELEKQNAKLKTALQKIEEYHCACSDGDEIIPQVVAREALAEMDEK